MELKNLAQKPLIINFKSREKLQPLYAQREGEGSWGIKLEILNGGNEIVRLI